ncbi:MAG: hypothetical protein HY553_03760 [Elusimicrobia bacterium]|nr:hypothetical protein [Elusimicrobiota bacterium]
MTTLIAAASLLFSPGSAFAAPEPVGVLQDVQGEVSWSPGRKAPPEILDDLRRGDSLKVGKGGSVTLLYYADCRQETISGPAKVKAGAKASVVDRKEAVKSEEVPCEPPSRLAETGASAAPQALTLMGGGGNKAKKRAERAFKARLQEAPEDVGTFLEFGAFLEAGRRYDEAEEQYRQALELRPDSRGIARRLEALKEARAAK